MNVLAVPAHPRVGLDAHHLTRHEGNRTYVRNLLLGFARTGVLGGAEGPGLAAYSGLADGGALPAAAGVVHRPLPGADRAWVRVPLAVPWLQVRDRLEVWHGAWTAAPWAPAPLVLTLHDVLFLTRPELFPAAARWRLRALVPAAARRARRVIATSAATRAALLAAIPGLDPARVVHVPFGVDTAVFRPEPEADDAARRRAAGVADDRPFVLDVGRDDPRKGLPALMEGLARARPGPSGPRLVLAGPLAAAQGGLLRAAAAVGLPAERLVVVADPDEATLAALYRGCALFCFPSLAEGVGLPVLEALACGAPVVTTRDPALAEAAAGAATLVEPGDRVELADAIDDGLAGRSRRGPARVHGLEAMARATAAVYRDVLDESS